MTRIEEFPNATIMSIQLMKIYVFFSLGSNQTYSFASICAQFWYLHKYSQGAQQANLVRDVRQRLGYWGLVSSDNQTCSSSSSSSSSSYHICTENWIQYDWQGRRARSCTESENFNQVPNDLREEFQNKTQKNTTFIKSNHPPTKTKQEKCQTQIQVAMARTISHGHQSYLPVLHEVRFPRNGLFISPTIVRHAATSGSRY